MENNQKNYLRLKEFVKKHPIDSSILIYGKFICGDFYSDPDSMTIGKITHHNENMNGIRVEIYTGNQIVEVDIICNHFQYEVL